MIVVTTNFKILLILHRLYNKMCSKLLGEVCLDGHLIPGYSQSPLEGNAIVNST